MTCDVVALVCFIFFIYCNHIHLKKMCLLCRGESCVFLCVFTVQYQTCPKNPFQGSFSLSSAAHWDVVGSSVQPGECRDPVNTEHHGIIEAGKLL